MKSPVHKILYRTLSLENYLRAVSRMFFLWQWLGIGRHARVAEYVYHLPQLVRPGDVAIDIGANLGYYTRTLSKLVADGSGDSDGGGGCGGGKVYAVEPMPPVLKVLRRNLHGCRNVEILPYALGAEERIITMANDSACMAGYFGTGQNFVRTGGAASAAGAAADANEEAAVSVAEAAGAGEAVEFTARMRRGSELFGALERIDFIKCDIEGYEVVVMEEMLPLIERLRPVVLIETGGENRARIIEMFTNMGYTGYTLQKGREVPLTGVADAGGTGDADGADEKDIIFRPSCE